MKDKIVVFVIGLLVGAIIASGAFLIYSSKTSNNNQMGQPPEMNENNQGIPPEKPDGDNGIEPPEKPSGEN